MWCKIKFLSYLLEKPQPKDVALVLWYSKPDCGMVVVVGEVVGGEGGWTMIQRLGKDFFTIGQPVWLHDPTTKAGVYYKLSPKWEGSLHYHKENEWLSLPW